MGLPTWMNNPAVYCVLLPPEDADDPARASAWMAKAGRPPGAYEIVPVDDPRFRAAVGVTVRSLQDQRDVGALRNRTWLVDAARGLFRVEFQPPEGRGVLGQVRPLGRVEDRLLRVLVLKSLAPPGAEGQ